MSAQGITRAGLDLAGGAITQTQSTVRADGIPVALDGDKVAPHGSGTHGSSSLVVRRTTTSVRVGGKYVVRAMDQAVIPGPPDTPCGHQTTGSSDVLVGG